MSTSPMVLIVYRFIFFALIVFPFDRPWASSKTTLPSHDRESGLEIVEVISNRDLSDLSPLGLFVTEITSQQIATIQDLNLSDALQRFASITITPSGHGRRLTSAFLRGFASRHIMVLIDGVEINDPANPSRSIDLSRIPLHFIDSIKVLRGPQSGFYGSDSIAGVVLVRTKRAITKSHSASLVGGSFGTRQVTGNHNIVSENHSLSISESYAKSDGISSIAKRIGGQEQDGYEEFSSHVQYQSQLAEDLDFRAYTGYIHQDVEDDIFIENLDDPNARTRKNLLFSNLNFDFSLPTRAHSLSMQVTHSETSSKNQADSINSSIYNELNRGRYFSIRQHNQLLISNNLHSHFGIEFEYEDFKNKNLTIDNSQNQSSTGVFAHLTSTWRNLTFLASLRGEALEKETIATHRISVNYIISERTNIGIAHASGFKSPSLYERFGQFGNPDLVAEKAHSTEVNVNQLFTKGYVKIGAFFSELDREISFQNSKFVNLNNQEQKGMDLEIGYDFFADTQVLLNLSLVKYMDKLTKLQALRRPYTQGSLTLSNQSFNNLRFDINFVYTGRRRDIDFVNFTPKDLKSILITNLLFDYTPKQDLSGFLRIENLFNQSYELIDGYGFARLNYMLGLKLTFH